MKLNPPQQKAVDHTEGALLVIAGAGSGKTRVLTERLAKIIELGLARPEDILTVTFTNKAAAEIKERALKRLNESAAADGHKQIYDIPWMGTFHSTAVKILRRHGHLIGLDNSFTIYDGDDQIDLVKKVMKSINLSIKDFNPRAILSGISSAKTELLTPEAFAAQVKGYYQETVADVYLEYQKQLRESRAVDFDDLLSETVRLLVESKEARDYYTKLFKYIMVDEYQDTNHAQYLIVKHLSSHWGNLCVVGDDDQSIYGWRGANVRNILEFERDFKDVKLIKLEQNYRSTKKIILAGNDIVKGIDSRQDKRLWTENPEGEDLTLYRSLDERDEAMWVVEQIEQLRNSGEVEAGEIAILYRMNAQSRLLEESCLKVGIPYKIVGNVRFYARKEIKDTLAYLRVIFNSADTLSLLRIINVPSRKIGAKTIDMLLSKAEIAGLAPLDYLLSTDTDLGKPLLGFAELMHKLRQHSANQTAAELIKFVIHESGYWDMLEDNTEANRQRQENLKELINVAEKYTDLSPEASLQSFLEEVALVEAQSDEQGTANDGVTLMTIHSAKGLEFGYVFLVGWEEGLFPHSRSQTDPSQLDEERRLAYVAVTRAEKKVHISFANTRQLFGSRLPATPSRFLDDIDSSIVEFKTFGSNYGSNYRGDFSDSGSFTNFNSDSEEDFDSQSSPQFNASPGDWVSHSHFGKGKIISIDRDYVRVNFERAGEKELATEYAGLVKL